MDAVIIGAGVTGLAIALELTSRGHKVGIVAKVMPSPM
jgi:2-polyprenyl-6-methoxyphenol hydroxylase-like FAD-dependent oxidoreductase